MTHDPPSPDGNKLDPDLGAVELAELRTQDGCATQEDAVLLDAAGLSHAFIERQQRQLTALMMADHDAPELVPRVFRALDIPVVASGAALLHDVGSVPELSHVVMAEVGLATVSSRRSLLHDSGLAPDVERDVLSTLDLGATRSREALLSGGGEAPDVVAPVLQAIDLPTVGSRDVLLRESGRPPELAGSVLGEVGLSSVSSVETLLRGAGEAPSLVAGVSDAIGLTELHLRDILLDAAGPAPDMVGGVMASLQLAGVERAEVADVLRSGAGPPPELGDRVMASLGLQTDLSTGTEAAIGASGSDEAALAPGNVVSLRRRRVALVVLPMLAMAAAVLLFVTQALVKLAPTDDIIGFTAGVANRIEIEEISTDVAAIVHVMPGDFDDLSAPTIIFIDVLEDDEDEPASKSKGKKL
jgi:hypothetical protein